MEKLVMFPSLAADQPDRSAEETTDFEALQREVDRLWRVKETTGVRHKSAERAERVALNAALKADSEWCWKMDTLVKKRKAAGQVWNGQRWD